MKPDEGGGPDARDRRPPGTRRSPIALARHVWRGGEPLWITYWLWGVGGNMSWVALLALLWLAGFGDPVLWPVWVLSVLWHAFIWGAIWRSGACYSGPRLWPLLARAGLFLGIPRLALEAWLIAAFSP